MEGISSIKLFQLFRSLEYGFGSTIYAWYGCLSRGLSFKLTMGNIVTLVPPLTITHDQMDSAILFIICKDI